MFLLFFSKWTFWHLTFLQMSFCHTSLWQFSLSEMFLLFVSKLTFWHLPPWHLYHWQLCFLQMSKVPVESENVWQRRSIQDLIRWRFSRNVAMMFGGHVLMAIKFCQRIMLPHYSNGCKDGDCLRCCHWWHLWIHNTFFWKKGIAMIPTSFLTIAARIIRWDQVKDV